jgi:hypothetical protein
MVFNCFSLTIVAITVAITIVAIAITVTGSKITTVITVAFH